MNVGQLKRTMACAIGLLVVLTSCSFARPLGHAAVEYNERLAHSHNELILLNIARAAHRHPMFFTGASQVNQNYGGSAGIDLTAPFESRSGDVSTWSSAPSFGVESGSSAQFSVYDTKEFVTGILTPIKFDTFAYLWSQGWPKDMLLHLLVSRITVETRSSEGSQDWTLRASAANNPGSRDHAAFKRIVGQLAALGFDIHPKHAELSVVGTAKEKASISDLIKADQAGFQVDSDGKTLLKMRSGWEVTYADWDDGVRPANATPNEIPRWSDTPERMAPRAVIQEGAAALTGSDSGRTRFQFRLRSPESVLYYLGELVREQRERGGVLVMVKGTRPSHGSRGIPLFVAGRGPVCSDCGPGVTYCGSNYVVDASFDRSRSMHVMSLSALLLALSKSADALPQSGFVTLVGR